MREEYSEYKGRQNRRHKKSAKSTGYLKKLLRQTIFSVIIFSVVISPEILGLSFGKNIKEITKSALLYTIDAEIVSQAFKNIYPHKGEEDNAKETTSAKDI